MLYVIIGNVLVYIISMMDTTGTFMYYLYFNSSLILKGQIWRLIAFVFIPTSSGLLWFAISLYFYYFIGSTLEKYWGTAKFTIFYLCGVLCTMIYAFVAGLFTPGYLAINAYYLNLSMFFAFAMLFPETRVLLFFFIPVKMKWLAIADAVLFVIGIVTGTFPVNLLPIIAIANFLLFFAGDFIDMFKTTRLGNSRQAVNFRKASKKAQRETADAPYRHKCAVCGRTDTEYPDLEFRYCSKCAGYHCFCIDHINHHIHFTE
ncbi:MAG: hypothetical protein IJL71_03060 [Oscillospiraceae bacterium]|nr:hypothetical protein [Oscillospiraceae bacterium]